MEKEENRLKFFPIMMFAIIMGLGGLTIVYQKAHEILSLPGIIGTLLVFITTGLFFIISIIYIIKWIKYPQVVKKEFSHPIRVNFFAAVSISMLLLTIIFKHINPTISAMFWYPAVVLHLFLTLNTISFWINHNQELGHSNPAWFIPIVGNVIIPVGGVGLMPIGFLTFFFSIGMFFWVILFAIIFNRIIFHHQLAIKFVPTLFILIAPPAVGFIAYFKLFHHLDFFAMFLFDIALFFTLLIAFMYRSFLGIKFFISWWAFIFPLAAMTIASILMYKITKDTSVLYLAYLMIITTTLIISTVIYQTIKNMLNHEICILE
jgi:tellurite resistance protein